MRMPPLLADFSHARACKPFCEKYLTLPKPGVSIFITPIQRKTHEPVTLLSQNLFFIKQIEFDKNDKNDYNDN